MFNRSVILSAVLFLISACGGGGGGNGGSPNAGPGAAPELKTIANSNQTTSENQNLIKYDGPSPFTVTQDFLIATPKDSGIKLDFLYLSQSISTTFDCKLDRLTIDVDLLRLDDKGAVASTSALPKLQNSEFMFLPVVLPANTRNKLHFKVTGSTACTRVIAAVSFWAQESKSPEKVIDPKEPEQPIDTPAELCKKSIAAHEASKRLVSAGIEVSCEDKELWYGEQKDFDLTLTKLSPEVDGLIAAKPLVKKIIVSDYTNFRSATGELKIGAAIRNINATGLVATLQERVAVEKSLGGLPVVESNASVSEMRSAHALLNEIAPGIMAIRTHLIEIRPLSNYFPAVLSSPAGRYFEFPIRSSYIKPDGILKYLGAVKEAIDLESRTGVVIHDQTQWELERSPFVYGVAQLLKQETALKSGSIKSLTLTGRFGTADDIVDLSVESRSLTMNPYLYEPNFVELMASIDQLYLLKKDLPGVRIISEARNVRYVKAAATVLTEAKADLVAALAKLKEIRFQYQVGVVTFKEGVLTVGVPCKVDAIQRALTSP